MCGISLGWKLVSLKKILISKALNQQIRYILTVTFTNVHTDFTNDKYIIDHLKSLMTLGIWVHVQGFHSLINHLTPWSTSSSVKCVLCGFCLQVGRWPLCGRTCCRRFGESSKEVQRSVCVCKYLNKSLVDDCLQRIKAKLNGGRAAAGLTVLFLFKVLFI